MNSSLRAASITGKGRFLSRSGLFLVVLALLGAVGPTSAASSYYNNTDDDYVDISDQDFDAVSIMPISCVN